VALEKHRADSQSAGARPIHNALDRVQLRRATRRFERRGGKLTADALMPIEARGGSREPGVRGRHRVAGQESQA
jgi:hypothetical protein